MKSLSPIAVRSEPIPATGDAAQTRQRMRVGMIGLAAVMLLIGLAAAIFSTATRERQVAAVGAANADVVANMVSGNSADPAGPREPLAELGVAPSAATDGANTTDPVADHGATRPR